MQGTQRGTRRGVRKTARATALAVGLVSAHSATALAQTDASTQAQPDTTQTQSQTQTQPPPPPPPPPEVTVHTIVTRPNADAASSSARPRFVELLTLRMMREKGIITEAEYRSARDEIGANVGVDRANENVNLVVGKWSASLYGFLETDFIGDSTQSFNDLAGNAQVLRPIGSPQPQTGNLSQYGGSNPRMQFSIRNTRFGLRLRAPEISRVRASGTLEMDFLGTDPAPSGGTSSTDAAFFNSPTLRVRHAYVKIETPIVDVLIGQYWHMFGWQGAYFPPTVEIQGLPGQLYERTAQLRLSHKFAFDGSSFEIAAAALRPPTRDGFIPDFAGGIRFAIDKWRGTQTLGATSTILGPASLAITTDYRDFRVPTFQATPTQTVSLSTMGIAVDAFLPIVPATDKRRDNSLSISGEFVYGGGISDMYTGLTGGITFPTYVNTSGSNSGSLTYPQNVDNGMVILDNCPASSGAPGVTACNNLHAIIWTTAIVGLQYYLPGGHVWVSGNYAHVESPNIQDFTNQGTLISPQTENYTQPQLVRKSEDWFDANVFFDPLPSVRIGLEYACFIDHYVDGIQATNHRGQISGFFLF